MVEEKGIEPVSGTEVSAEAARLAEEKRLANGVVTLPGGVELEMVKVEAGSFTMGSPAGEDGRYDDETQHRVTLTQDFWLGKYEVTQAQWEAVMGNNPSVFFNNGGNHPVEWVSWEDAQAFCRELNELYAGKLPPGYRFGLPTEAQWEYACRAGTTTAFHYGDASDARKMNHDGNFPCGGGSEGADLRRTTPVGSYAPNAWGLYDMHGNVWEWCEDRYGSYGGDGVDPREADSGSGRVVRGGSWLNHAWYCRSANRSYDEPTSRDGDLGFRLALRPIQRGEAARVARVSENDRKAKERAKVAAEAARLAEERARKASVEEAARLANGVVTLPGGVTLEMVKVEAGSFMMGSPAGEDGREDDETLRRVTLTKDFWLGKYEVTQVQWEAVMGNNRSYFKKGGNHPVESVSWEDAQAFCKKLNEQYAGKLPSGYCFGLPTEAQWEYACRAGKTTAFHYGDASDARKMNHDGNYPCGGGSEGAYLERTTPVGSYAPNAWGLYDMHGNVWEWCEDRYGPYGGDGVDPRGADSGSNRVVRGGSWDFSARDCRSAYRGYYEPTYRDYDLGFRLALCPIH